MSPICQRGLIRRPRSALRVEMQSWSRKQKSTAAANQQTASGLRLSLLFGERWLFVSLFLVAFKLLAEVRGSCRQTAATLGNFLQVAARPARAINQKKVVMK